MHDIGERNDTLELDRALLACFISTRFLRSACPWTRNYCNVMLFSANLFFFSFPFFFWNARYCLTRAEKRYRRDTRGSIGAMRDFACRVQTSRSRAARASRSRRGSFYWHFARVRVITIKRTSVSHELSLLRSETSRSSRSAGTEYASWR